jgi:UDP-N-acetylglucosamine 2-epimerase (non-hydrolysing)
MPEETNRIVTDHLSELLFTTCADADQNLLAEGIDGERIHFVGNPMIDALDHCLGAARERRAWESRGFAPGGYAPATLHRPPGVGDRRRRGARRADTRCRQTGAVGRPRGGAAQRR